MKTDLELVQVQDGLMPIYTYGESGDRLVDARTLHAQMEVGRDFSTWIRDRIKKFGFVEHFDFTTFTQSGDTATGGFRTIEYALTMDMAKELAMLQNSEKGRQARRYFIEAEKEFGRMRDFLLSELQVTQQTQERIASIPSLPEKSAADTAFENAMITKALMMKYRALGLDKLEAAVIVQKAVSRGENPDAFVEEKLSVLRSTDLKKKRNRIFVRIQRIGSLLSRVYPDMQVPYEEAWHYLSDELVFEAGTTKTLRKRHEKDKEKYEKINNERLKGDKKLPCPGYLDYIEEGNLYKEAEKVANKLIKKYSALEAKRIREEENNALTDVVN